MDQHQFPTMSVNEQPTIGVANIATAHHSHHKPKEYLVTLEMIYEQIVELRADIDVIAERQFEFETNRPWNRFRRWLKKYLHI